MAATVLAVDDDPFILKVLERYLDPEGLTVVTAATGESALSRVAGGGIDLVILDLNLPSLDGFEVCRRLKADAATRRIPVIMLTAAHADDAERGYDAGADAYMAKPFLRRSLLYNVHTLLKEA